MKNGPGVYTKVTPKKADRRYGSATPEKMPGPRHGGRMPIDERSSTRGAGLDRCDGGLLAMCENQTR